MANVWIRPGPDGTTIDLVFREGGLIQAVPSMLRGGALVGIFTAMAVAISGSFVVVGLALAGVEPTALDLYLLVIAPASSGLLAGCVLGVRRTDIQWVQFRPPTEPTELRIVYAREGRWQPISVLERVDLTTWMELPHEGDLRPAKTRISVVMTIKGKPYGSYSMKTRNPETVRQGLAEILGPAGIPVELTKESSVIREDHSGFDSRLLGVDP
ncbi:hypothetical protein ACFCX4_13315 [Kitasatospora sp. NPDC056327]|uniref:hypothetical protein n=1 Tax=Kitasatospora sp. NPDC056327 TaxID=3345785 RepID=UPI0035E348B9